MQKTYCDVTGQEIEFEEDAYTISVRKANGKAGMPNLLVHPTVIADLKKWLLRSSYTSRNPVDCDG